MLKNYTLLKSQKNRVYEILRQAGLEPADFSWEKEEIASSLVVSRLIYRDGTYYFQFSSYEMNAWCTACPGQFRNLDYEYPRTWEEQEGVFQKWAQCLRREVATADPWGDLSRYRLVLGPEPIEETVNEPISVQDAQQIEQGLLRLGDAIARELGLSDDQAGTVRARLGYLAEAAKRQRSQDWLFTALGVYATLGAALVLPEATLKTMWHLFQAEAGQFAHPTQPRPGTPNSSPKIPIVAVEPPASPAAEQPQKHRRLFF